VDDKLETGRTLEALRKKNLEGKKTFIEELKRQKTPKSISLLLEIMCDESWYLRELAILALAEAGSLATEPLRRILASGLWYTRSAAARALGRMGDEESAGPFLALLEESNRTVRESAVAAIQALVAQAGINGLCDALAALPPDRRSARLRILAAYSPELAARIEGGVEQAVTRRFLKPPAQAEDGARSAYDPPASISPEEGTEEDLGEGAPRTT
jgi:HEAT repeat protein